MITTKLVTSRRHDIFDMSGKYLGDASCGHDGLFQWFPIFSSTPVFAAATLRAIADFLDHINTEATKQDANPPTATD